MITGRAALRLHGLRQGPEPDRVHLLDPACPAGAQLAALHVERTSRMPRALERAGLAVAPLCPGRARRGPRLSRTRGRSRRAWPNPSSADWCHRSSCSRNSTPGAAKGSSTPRAVLRAIEDGVRSVAEFDCAGVVARPAGAPAGALQRARPGRRAAGRWASSTCSSRSAGSPGRSTRPKHHFATPDQVEATSRRQRALRAVGLHLVSTRPVPTTRTTRRGPFGTSWTGWPSPQRCPHRGRPSRTTSAASPESPSVELGDFLTLNVSMAPTLALPERRPRPPESYSSIGVEPSPVSTAPVG